MAPNRHGSGRRRIATVLTLTVLFGAVLFGAVVIVAGGHVDPSMRAPAGGLAAVPAARDAEPVVEPEGLRPVAASVRVPRTWGVALPNLPTDLRALSSLSRTTGHRPSVATWYVAWSLRTPFPTADANRVRAQGATPEITWEPWLPGAGVDQPTYSLARIARGDFDAYLTSWARAIRAWGHPVRLRFAQEMNGSWYPWAEGVNGNRGGSFVAAWRHIHQIFASAGATGVTWVWSPNVPFPGSVALAKVFPGDAYVSEVALDGYNWSTLNPGSSWTSFAQVFGPGITALSHLSKRPVSIGEVGCPEVGGDKAEWISGMWRTLTHWPQVRGVMWFSFDKEADWRLDSSTSALRAFSHGLPVYLAR